MSARPVSKTPGIPAEVTFQQVLDALLDQSKPFNPKYLYLLADLDEIELRGLEKTWPQVSPQRRQAILEDIEELGEADDTLSFEGICLLALSDSEPNVRELAVRILGEYETASLVPVFLNLLTNDIDSQVRAASASALGNFVYLGETDALPGQALNEIIDHLLIVHNSQQPALLRRRALESLGYSSREEIPHLIEAAYYSSNRDWVVSALFAMGRSINTQWNSLVLETLESDDPEILLEAVRAAGELEIQQASPRLMELLDDNDSDLRLAAIWSLSQIGGEGVEEALLNLLEDIADDDEANIIEDALENLQFTEDKEIFALFDVDDENDKDEEGIEDIDDIDIEFDEDEK